MSTIANARELGGYKTRDGRTVCKGVLLRTAALTEASQEELDSLIRQYNFMLMDEQMMARSRCNSGFLRDSGKKR